DDGGGPEGIVLRQMIICADDCLILCCSVGSIEGVVGTTADRRVRCRNKLLQQFSGDRIETARWELNASRGKAGIPRSSGRATCNGKWNRIGRKADDAVNAVVGDIVVRTEIPVQLRGTEHRRQLGCAHPVPEPLVREKEEETILDEGPTQRSPIQVLVKI